MTEFLQIEFLINDERVALDVPIDGSDHLFKITSAKVGFLLREFLQILLNDTSGVYRDVIRWQDHSQGIFKIFDPAGLAKLWGQHKNLSGMTYQKLTRSLRNYYKTNKLKKVARQQHVYQFLFSDENPPLSHAKLRRLIKQINLFKSSGCTTGQRSGTKVQVIEEILIDFRETSNDSNTGQSVHIKSEELLE